MVKLWSALPFPTTKSNATGNDSQRGERRVFSHDEYIGLVMRSSVMTHDYSAGSTAENPRMMAFFDSLVQREIEGRDSDDSDNSEGDNDGSEDYFDTVHSDDDEEDTGTVNYTRRERTEINEIGNTSNNSSNSVSAENNESLNTRSEVDSSLRQEAETQTPRQSSQNIIADLIAKKRGQLLRKSRRRDNSFQDDEDQVNKILRSAKRTLRSRDKIECM